MFKILISDPLDKESLAVLKNNKHFSVTEDRKLDNLDKYDAWLVRSGTTVTAQHLAKTKNLRLVGRAGTGVDNIDIKEATKRGVLVINVAGANAVAVAEHVFALMLAMVRKLIKADKLVKAGGWRSSELKGNELNEKKLGILGFGKVGKIVAKIAASFNMKVLAFDPFINKGDFSMKNVEVCSLEDVLKSSDIITLHVPLTEKTRHLINSENLALCKKGVLIINTSRGEIINEADLAKAIKEEKVAAAAMDVYENEPPLNSPLLGLEDRVVLTPHIAASTKETQKRVSSEVVKNMIDYFERGIVRGGVNVPAGFEADTVNKLGSYLALAERLGSFLGQLAPGAWRELSCAVHEKFEGKEQNILLNAAVMGLLRCSIGDKVNMVNASFMAKESSLNAKSSLIEQRDEEHPLEEINLSISLKDSQTYSVSGGVIAGKEMLIVRIGKLFVDVVPEGTLLLLNNIDKPGMIGKVGSLLGKHKINIADMRVGRKHVNEEALMVLTVDSCPMPSVLKELKKISGITNAAMVNL
ncbi:phosphoglycerate dehydrogenase [Elusimicrobiota bacterium]